MRDDNIPMTGPGEVPWYEEEPEDFTVCDWCGKLLYEGDHAYVVPCLYHLSQDEHYCSDGCLNQVELEPKEKPVWRKLTYRDMAVQL